MSQMHYEIRQQKASSSDPPTTGSSGDPGVTDPRSLARERHSEPAIDQRGQPFHCAHWRPPTLCKGARPDPATSRGCRSHGLRTIACRKTPGNTAGPVLPHRPSKTLPVLRNHREGQVTVPNVTTPVGKDKSRRSKDNIRWPKDNTAETIDVPNLYLAATTWGRCDRPASVAGTFRDASTLAA